MNFMMYIGLIVGFVLLVKGADLFVEGSCSVARALKVPSVVIGLTIVAMGTSAPEAAVSITAGLAGNNDIALGNILGSNMFNLLVVIGACAVIQAFDADKEILKRDLPINIVVSLVLLVFVMDGKLQRSEGLILLAGMVAYLVLVVVSALKNRVEAEEEIEVFGPVKTIVLIIVGVGAIILGGNLVVDSACDIAAFFGMSQNLIALTIVAVGTSLPELVTSITAARKGEPGLALGNAVGSSLFNVLFILGASSAISPITGSVLNIMDAGMLLLISVLIGLFCYTRKRVTRGEGALCILVYVAYIAFAVLRA
jgi:cation:H+ antiporter